MNEGTESMSSTDSSHYVRKPAVERELAHQRRLVHGVDSERPTQLAGSAPIIWDLLHDHSTAEGLVAMLQQHYSDAPEVIRAGLEVGLAHLVNAGLVEVHEVQQ